MYEPYKVKAIKYIQKTNSALQLFPQLNKVLNNICIFIENKN